MRASSSIHHCSCWTSWCATRFRIALAVGAALAAAMAYARADDEALIVTPPGFTRAGDAKTAFGAGTSRLKITVRDRTIGPANRLPAQRRRVRRSLLSAGAQSAISLQPDRPVARRPARATARARRRSATSAGSFTRPEKSRSPSRPATCASRPGKDSSTGRKRRASRRPPVRRSRSISCSIAPCRWPRSATIRATRICTSRARPRLTTASSSTCSRPKISTSARSWPITSRPARTRA